MLMHNGTFFINIKFQEDYQMVRKVNSRSMKNTKGVLYDAITAVEVLHSVQVRQNSARIQALAEAIMRDTRNTTTQHYINTLYRAMAKFMEDVDFEIKEAIENKTISKGGYVLAINA